MTHIDDGERDMDHTNWHQVNNQFKLHDGDLLAVGWDDGPRALVTPVKAIRVGLGPYKKQPIKLISLS